MATENTTFCEYDEVSTRPESLKDAEVVSDRKSETLHDFDDVMGRGKDGKGPDWDKMGNVD
ncbi:hypothetical protein BVY04_05140 [bacterium M21]|nr:hypothetical protein BVY04_05140 [bacterium M21]